MVSPIVDEIAEESDGSYKVGKINVDEQPELASAFRVMSIPTLIVMKDGLVTGEFEAPADHKPSQLDVVSLMM